MQYFPALLPECSDEDPSEVFEGGGVPGLAELRLHNGTVYRWNRPIYDTHDGRPHLRVENRVLPAGPSIVDVWRTQPSTTARCECSPRMTGRCGPG